MAEEQERAFDGEEENRSDSVNTKLDPEQGSGGGHCDFARGAKLRDEMDHEFLNEVGAVGNAGDESGARDFDPAKWKPRTDRADEERGHAKSDERKLPDGHCDSDGFRLAEIKGITDYRQGRQPKPGREVRDCFPPARTESLNRGLRDTEHKRIESAPGRVIDPGLIAAKSDALFAEILQGKKPAEREPEKNDRARNEKRSATPTDHQEQDEREEQIELVFDRERPGVGERGTAAESDVLN